MEGLRSRAGLARLGICGVVSWRCCAGRTSRKLEGIVSLTEGSGRELGGSSVVNETHDGRGWESVGWVQRRGHWRIRMWGESGSKEIYVNRGQIDSGGCTTECSPPSASCLLTTTCTYALVVHFLAEIPCKEKNRRGRTNGLGEEVSTASGGAQIPIRSLVPNWCHTRAICQ